MDEIRKRKIYWHKNTLVLDRSRSHPSILARSSYNWAGRCANR